MKVVLLVVALAHAAMCGNVARTSSLLSPAGVTYVDGSYHAGLAAGPVGYSASATAAPVAAVSASRGLYASAPAVAAAPVAAVSASPALYATAPAVAAAPVAAVSASPALYASAPTVAAAPVASVSASQGIYASAPGVSASPAVYSSGSAIAAAPVVYSPASVTKYAAVSTVQHVPAVADFPVTRINAQPGVIQKTLDVARPAVKTQRYEVRRPAIQKQFYDIEERVVVRPAGSAVVELEEPLSRTQKGPSVIQPTGGAVVTSSSESVAVPTGPGVSSISTGSTPLPPVDFSLRETTSGALPPAPPAPQAPFVSTSIYPGQTSAILPPAAPVLSAATVAPISSVSVSAPAQTVAAAAPAGISTISAGSSGLHSTSAGSSGIAFSTPVPQYADDSVTIQSAAFNAPRSDYSAQFQAAAYQSEGVSTHRFQAAAPQAYATPVAVPQTYSVPVASSQGFSAPTIPSRQTIFKSALPTTRFSGSSASAPARSATFVSYPASTDFAAPQKFSATAIYSDGAAQSHISQANQQKLIQLLTARGGVTEVGFGRSGSASNSYPVNAGEVRGRVISATPAPAYATPTNERVNTRRVVVSRPIETLQEVEVAEPVTKYERVQVSQPTVIKTASQDVVRVPTSVPVYGKALAPVAEENYATLSSEWQ